MFRHLGLRPFVVAMTALTTGFLTGCDSGSQKNIGDRAPESGSETPSASAGGFRLLDFSADPPEAWAQETPDNTMRMAQFTTPAPEGEEEGLVIVFYFGEGQGGSVEANLDRWSRQFADDAGNPVEPEREKLDDAAFPTTLARYDGTYTRTRGMGGSSEPVPGQTMVAAIAETPKGSLFFQLTGPTATVEAQREAFRGFVSSLGR
jgi:hypothetical protein